MDKETLKEEIKSIDEKLKELKDVIKRIDSLKKEKSALKKKLDVLETKELPFEKKFEKWLYSSYSGVKGRWIPSEEAYPNLRALMRNRDFNRYETIDISNDYPFSEYWDCILEPDGRKFAEDEEWDYETILKAAKEVMDSNLKSFKYDW